MEEIIIKAPMRNGYSEEEQLRLMRIEKEGDDDHRWLLELLAGCHSSSAEAWRIAGESLKNCTAVLQTTEHIRQDGHRRQNIGLIMMMIAVGFWAQGLWHTGITMGWW